VTGSNLWPLPCEASAAPTRCSPAPCFAPHRPSSSALTSRGDILLRTASQGWRADKLLTTTIRAWLRAHPCVVVLPRTPAPSSRQAVDHMRLGHLWCTAIVPFLGVGVTVGGAGGRQVMRGLLHEGLAACAETARGLHGRTCHGRSTARLRPGRGAGPGERASRNGRRLGSVDPSRLPLRQSCPISCLDPERASFHV